MTVIERIDEFITEAENEPSWTATQALRCLRKELTEEQEPKQVNSDWGNILNRWERKGFCPRCNQEMRWMLNRSFCGFCGQAVKWDD